MASDLVLHCLLMSHKHDARLKWVKTDGSLGNGNMKALNILYT